MKKILRRILVIMLLLLVLMMVGYLGYNYDKLTRSVEYDSLQKSAYKSKNNTVLVFSDENIWYFVKDDTYICEFESYEKTTLIIKADKQSFQFRVIDVNTIYDIQTKELLRKGGSG